MGELGAVRPWHIIVAVMLIAVALFIVRGIRRRRKSRAAMAMSNWAQRTAVSPMPYQSPSPVANPRSDPYPSQVVTTRPGPPAEESTAQRAAAPSRSLPMAGAIFISYRRADNPHAAHRLYDHLCRRFGPRSTFIDLDNIEPGADFVLSIDDAIAQSRVLLAVIGQHWLDAVTEAGVRRLDDPADLVRIEIEVALRLQVRVIPVLADATMPTADQLPGALKDLARRNAVQLRIASFLADCEHLTRQLEQIMGQ